MVTTLVPRLPPPASMLLANLAKSNDPSGGRSSMGPSESAALSAAEGPPLERASTVCAGGRAAVAWECSSLPSSPVRGTEGTAPMVPRTLDSSSSAAAGLAAGLAAGTMPSCFSSASTAAMSAARRASSWARRLEGRASAVGAEADGFLEAAAAALGWATGRAALTLTCAVFWVACRAWMALSSFATVTCKLWTSFCKAGIFASSDD
mmetsp:Transcript_81257/g.218548  ORF Transcript_81257/g.218548 Transcript_81257/m.218548 type:complete len:207 (+) Transcript_81257:177-797(+)